MPFIPYPKGSLKSWGHYSSGNESFQRFADMIREWSWHRIRHGFLWVVAHLEESDKLEWELERGWWILQTLGSRSHRLLWSKVKQNKRGAEDNFLSARSHDRQYLFKSILRYQPTCALVILSAPFSILRHRHRLLLTNCPRSSILQRR